MTKTRSEKYRELRDTISFDTQVEKNNKALKDFEERLNKIDPHLMDTVGNDLSDFSQEADLMDTSHSLRPFGNVSSGKARPDSDPVQYTRPQSTARPYASAENTADVQFPSGKPMSKERLRKRSRICSGTILSIRSPCMRRTRKKPHPSEGLPEKPDPVRCMRRNRSR